MGSACAFFLWVTRGGGLPPAGHTQQSGKPDCRGPEAKPHQQDTPNTPIPGGAQCLCVRTLKLHLLLSP